MPGPTLEPGAGEFDPRVDYVGGAPSQGGRLGKEDMPVDEIGGAWRGDTFIPVLPPEKRTHIQLQAAAAASAPPESAPRAGATPHTAFIKDEQSNFVDLETLECNYAGRTFKLSESEALSIRKTLTRGVERELREERARVRASLHESGRKGTQVQEDGGGSQPVREMPGDSPGEYSETPDVGA